MLIIGGYTALSTKGIASLLSYQLWKVITFPVTYLLLAILVFTAVMQVKYVNRALQRFDSTQVIPTQFVMFTLFVILGSAILYRDFENRSTEDATKFFGGCALTFLGVWLITSGRGKETEDEEPGEDEEAINLVDEERFQNTVADVNPPRKPSYASGSQKGFSTTDLPEDKQAPPMPRMHSTPEYAVSIVSAPHATTPSPSSPPSSAHGASRGPSLDYQSALDLPNNPWASGTPSPVPSSSHRNQHDAPPLGLPKPPTLNTTSSDSIVPATTRSSSHRPRTPHDPLSNTNPSNHLTPDRRTVLPRHSITDMFTTPLSAPLSSSLSAVVADNLRHGVTQRSRRASLREMNRTSSTKRKSMIHGQSQASLIDSPTLGRRGVSEPELVPGDVDDSRGDREEGLETQTPQSKKKGVGEALEGIFRKGRGLRKEFRRNRNARTEGDV